MKAGLFVCDHVGKAYQEEFGDYPDMFAKLFSTFDWVLYDVYNGEFPKDLDECDVYMATGSKHSVYEEIDWITKLKRLITELYKQQKLFVGFCFGHQLIGEALGGKVGKSDKGWCVGVLEFEITEHQEWMNPPQPKVNVLMMCQDQILQLPPKSTVLASNPKCPVGMIQVGETMLGIQAHPEFSKAYDKVLMGTRGDKIGAVAVEKGLESLSDRVDSDVLEGWIEKFLSLERYGVK